MSNKGMTVEELFVECGDLVKAGLGKKHIQISMDDEGNGYHTLFFGFTTEKKDIKELTEDGALMHDDVPLKDIVILG